MSAHPLAALVLAGCLLAPAAPALAKDDEGAKRGPCVTKAEFRKVDQDMAKARVHRIFDTRGWRSRIERNRVGTQEHRKYKPCKGNSVVVVRYVDWNRDGDDRLRVSRKYRA